LQYYIKQRRDTMGKLISLAILSIIGAVKLKYKLLMVSGSSMYPTLKEGDVLLVDKRAELEEDQIVILKDPQNPKKVLVKRIIVLDSEYAWVEGDNNGNSRDSRDFGEVSRTNIIGKVIKVWEK